MKKIAVLFAMFCVSFVFAQNDDKVKYEKKGDLVEATIYNDDGSIEQHGFFKDKKLHGTWTYFNTEGKKVAIGNYKLGVKTGKWLFYSNGEVKQVNYLNGKVVKVSKKDNASMAYN